MRKSTRTVLAGLTLAVALGASGCSATTTDIAGSADSVTVKVGTLRGQPHFYHPFLYENEAPEGVTFEVVTLDTTPALSDALVSGAIDFAITGVTPTISSIAQGRDLKVIASAADGGSGFVGGEDIQSLDDLVGKNVGYIAGSAQEVALRLTLDAAGIDPADLNLMVVPVPDMAGAFASGSVDAFFGVEIGASIALQNGGHLIADAYDTPIGKVNIGLATTGALIESDPELVQKVVDTHIKTVAYMVDNQDIWLTEMVNTFGGDEEIFTSALENFWMRSDLSEEYQGQLVELATQMQWLGLIEVAPDASDIVDTTFVDAATAE
ncbi:transporter substrate-binding domain-containing protein [Cryobacterium glaciale]|uniref:Transporter substrate-binding domain-containing protein n=1 Tax=Cryobacterium glaciale TaxID=1259145 RepID=A0A4R8V369_9MICO|nr:NrtA/SsuA/CpmA family ABC transporter substrate-binding protein [Cryobacterium glaciale]TFB76278.1 transporter substrate-binding domain-containing protein [Cryobacterium glaciale]